MDEVIRLGPLLIKLNWIAVLLSGTFGYLLIKCHLKRKEEAKHGKILDTIGNSIFMGFIIWKLSLILLNPISVIHNPMVLLYFSGGYRGWMIALVFVFAYILYQSKKQNEQAGKYFQLYGLGFSAANFFYYLIFMVIDPGDLLFPLGQIVFSLIFIWWFYKAHAAHSIFQGLVWLGIIQIFVFFFKDRHAALWLGLSKDQLIFLVVSLMGFIGSWIQKRWLNFNES